MKAVRGRRRAGWRKWRYAVRRLWLGACVALVGALIMVGGVRAQEGENRAALVIIDGDGAPDMQCVTFDEPEITGYELLRRSGKALGVVPMSAGTAICQIDGVGCNVPQENCFCQCQGAPCRYWSYWQQMQGAWQYSVLGGDNTIVRNGDVQGWVWGTGVIGQEADLQPPATTFDQICPAQAPTATPTDTPTLQVIEANTSTPTTAPTGAVTETLSPTPTFTPETPTPTFTPLPPPTATFTPLPPGAPTPLPITTPPEIRAFDADRTTINFGEPMMLAWEVAGADTVALRSPGGEELLPAQGNKTMTPAETTTFTLVARGPGGESSAAVQVVVNAVIAAPTAPPVEEAVTDLALPIDTPTWTPAPLPVDTPIPIATPIPMDTPIQTHVVPADQVAPGQMITSDQLIAPGQVITPSRIVTIVITTVPESAATSGAITEAVALAPPTAASAEVDLTLLPAVASAREEAATARAQRLLLLAGLGFVMGAPLVFGAIWIVMWAVWRRR